MLRRNLPDEWITWGKSPPEYWSSIINDPELHPEIRDNSVTVYYCGAALIRNLSLVGDSVTGDVHFKYVPIREPVGSKYLKMIGNSDGLSFEIEVELLSLENCSHDILSDYKRIMRSVGLNPESHIVHKITSRPENSIVDQEIKFQIPGETNSDKIDICHFDTTHNCLAFVEVKGIHDPRLKSNTDDAPEVIQQLKSYRERIDENYKEIIKAYQTTVALKRQIGLAGRIKSIPQSGPSRLMKKTLLVIGGCNKNEVKSILDGQGEWKALHEGVEKEASGLIVCGNDGCALDLRTGRQRILFDDSVFDA